jgi:hypothetical protein
MGAGFADRSAVKTTLTSLTLGLILPPSCQAQAGLEQARVEAVIPQGATLIRRRP